MSKLDSGVVVADRFRLERLVGRGGMGAVWRAHHLALDVPCALKVIDDRGADDAQYRARFQQEAQAAAKLRHPNVVQVYDHGVWEDMPWIAMELLEGESLADRLDRLGRLSLSDTLGVVSDIAQALTRAEELGIVHRDLKPENILLVAQAGREVAKLLDFGVAKIARGPAGGARTVTGAFLGTPQYVSPEQAHGARDVDHRSDLWSLAVVAFESITGRRPFDGAGMGEVLAAVLTKEPPLPSSVDASLPAALDAWWVRATARVPDDRFQSALEMSEALRAVVERSEARIGVGGPAPSTRSAPGVAHAATVPMPGEREPRAPAAPTLGGDTRPIVAPRPSRRRAVAAGVAVAFAGTLGAAFLLRPRTPEAPSGVSSPATLGAPAESTIGASPQAPLGASTQATPGRALPARMAAAANSAGAPAEGPDAAAPPSAGAPTSGRKAPAAPVVSSRPTGAPTSTGPRPLEPGY